MVGEKARLCLDAVETGPGQKCFGGRRGAGRRCGGLAAAFVFDEHQTFHLGGLEAHGHRLADARQDHGVVQFGDQRA